MQRHSERRKTSIFINSSQIERMDAYKSIQLTGLLLHQVRRNNLKRKADKNFFFRIDIRSDS